MNTIHKFPASKLPAELRGDLADDQFVTVMIAEEEDSDSYAAWLDDLVGSLKTGQADIKAGRGIPADTVFANMREMVAAKSAS